MTKYLQLLLVLFFVVSFEVGCAPSASSIQTAIAETQISLPVPTPSKQPTAVVPLETLVPTPEPPVSKSIYLGTVNGKEAIFVSSSDPERKFNESYFSSYPYLGKVYLSERSEFDFNFKDLVDPQLLFSIPGNVDSVKVDKEGSLFYISGIMYADNPNPADGLYVYSYNPETGEFKEVYFGAPGYVDEVWEDYLVIKLLPCYHCSPGPMRYTVILNGITGASKYLGEVGDVYFSAVDNSVWYRQLNPIELPCAYLGEGCGEDGFYTDYEPSGEFFSEPLPSELTATQESIPVPATVLVPPYILFSNLDATEIYSVDLTGDNLRWLTEDALDARNPVWSPDGTRFAYISSSSEPGSRGEITISDTAGNLTSVFNEIWEGGGGGDGVTHLRWNSDGSKLYYLYAGELYEIKTAGGSKPELLDYGDDRFSLSLDGSKIAYDQLNFGTDGSRNLDIFVKTINDEQGLHLWVSEKDPYHSPLMKYMEWSYDGKLLAFMVDYQNDAAMKLYVVDTDGRVLVDRAILNTPIAGEEENEDAPLLLKPDWSPDSAQLTFVDDNEIYSWDALSVDPDKVGSGFSNLTNTEFGIERFPVWSPDGNRVAYLSYTTSSQDSSPVLDLYIMNPDGSKKTRMTVDKNIFMGSSKMRERGFLDIGLPLFFDWSPDSTQIVYSSEGVSIYDCTQMDCSQGPSKAGIYLLDVATGESRYLTNPDVGGINPMWQPQP